MRKTQLLVDMKDMQNTSMNLKGRATSQLEYLTSLADTIEPSIAPRNKEVSVSAPQGSNDIPPVPKRSSEHGIGDIVAFTLGSTNPSLATAASVTKYERSDYPAASRISSRDRSTVTKSEPTSSDAVPSPLGSVSEPVPLSLSAQEFEEKLSTLLVSASAHHMCSSKPFSEDVIIRIAELLMAVGKLTWSERPRTYLVLRLISEVKVMDDIVLNGYKDIDFPYTESTTPECLKQLGAQHNFLHIQRFMLSEKSADLVQGGRHRHLGKLISDLTE
jgi:hypothetical protein